MAVFGEGLGEIGMGHGRADVGENKNGSIIANWLCLIGMGTI